MNRRGGDPLLAAGDHRRAHEVIVDDVGEVIGRKAVGLQDDDVGVVFLQFDFAADDVGEFDFAVMVAIRVETDDPGSSCLNARNALLVGEIAVAGIFAIIARKRLDGLLLLTNGIEILGGAEVRIGPALGNEVFDDGLVDVGTRGLLIWPVSADIAVWVISFVRLDSKIGELIDEVLSAALDGALGIRVLKAEAINALCLLRRHAGNHGREKRARMKEARGRGREARDLRTFR